MAYKRARPAPLDASGPERGRPELFDPWGGKPAADPEPPAAELLDHGKDGKPAKGDAGPLAAGRECADGRR
jgi:hypothetical protein